MKNLKQKYIEEIRPDLVKELGVKNEHAVPCLDKVVVNIGVGEEAKDKNQLKQVKDVLAAITGQLPTPRQAKISVSGFNVRQGMVVGLSVTLRGQRMYDFTQKLFSIVLPRIRDFRGVPLKGFDKHGNYTLGIAEYNVFPEVDVTQISKNKGLEITFVVRNSDSKKSKLLLEKLGMPLERSGKEA